MKNLKKEIFDNDEILNIVNEIIEEDKNIKNLKKDYPDKIEILEEALLNYMGENDLNFFKQEFPDKWKHLTKNWHIHLNILIVLMIIGRMLTT